MVASAKVFVSGTSGDLGTFRRAVSEALITLGVLPVVQERFPPDTGTVVDLLREKISHCDATICLVGERYGVEPKTLLPGAPRRSYSQIEYELAIELGKPVFLFLSSPNCEFDPSATESAELLELQRQFRERLRNGDKLWTQFRSRDDLVAKVMLLRFDPESIAANLNSRLSVLLFTDLVDSTGLKSRMGDDDYARQIAIPHNYLFREILKRFRDAHEENYTGDGFLATFDRVQDAVSAALLFHDALEHYEWGGEIKPKTRIGIHLGQVTRVPGADQRRPHIASHSADLCARLMSLGRGGQTLLTRAAFDNARQYLRAAPVWGPANVDRMQLSSGDSSVLLEPVRELCWLSHGRYVFQGRDEPMEVFEVGVVGRAPLKAPDDSEKVRRADSLEEQRMLGWQPGVGQEIPERKGWRIHRKLGEGGFGEVWLAKNTDTRRLRVFKFCMDPTRLQSLRRELSLFLLMKEALGDLDNIVPLHEVRLEKRPYYLESEYVAGGNLRQWVDRRGGFAKIPLEERLRLMQEIAHAVAVAHSVGIIHRDLKPSNIFMSSQGPDARVVLADFGIGALVDRSLMERYGLALNGFTDRTLLQPGARRSGSRMYLPPEDQVGGPATKQSDVYALGVLLFQILAGDFDRPLGPGWERVLKVSATLDGEASLDDGIMRHLLMDDVAVSVDADLRRRLPDAGRFAERLADLPHRTERAHAERRRANMQLRLRNFGRRCAVAGGLASLLVCLSLFSVYQWRQAELHAGDAEAARAQACTEADRARALLISSEQHRQRAEAHRQQADENREAILETIRRLVFDLQEQMTDHMSAPETQQAILSTALQGLKKTDVSAPEASVERARLTTAAQIKTADLCLSLGRTVEAEQHLESARGLLGQLKDVLPDSPETRRDLSLIYERLGNACRRRGELEAAREYYLLCLKQSWPASAEIAKSPADGQIMQVSYAPADGARSGSAGLGEATRCYDHDLELMSRPSDATSRSAQDLRDVAVVYHHLGEVCVLAGDLTMARYYFGSSYDLRQQRATALPGHPGAQRDLCVGQCALGDVSTLEGDFEAARRYYEQSHRTQQSLALKYPQRAQYLHDLLVTCHKLGHVCQAQGNLAAAKQYADQDLSLAEQLAARNPARVGAQREVAVSLVRVACVAEACGDTDTAVSRYEQAATLLETLQIMGGLTGEHRRWPERTRAALSEILLRPVDALRPLNQVR